MRYAPERYNVFNYSHMKQRVQFLILQPDGTYTPDQTVWAYAEKRSTLTQTQTENYYYVVVRDQSALDNGLLSTGNRLQWGNIQLSMLVWERILYDRKGYVEILCEQVASDATQDIVMYPDIVSVYAMTEVQENNYGLTSYRYNYDFTTPSAMDIRCKFPIIDKSYVQEGRVNIEYDKLVVVFNADAPIKLEDYIISPIHGKFKIDMIVKNDKGEYEASVVRSDIQ